MLLKNKVTGEINIVKVEGYYFNIYKDDGEFVCPVTLKELNEGWCDYEEPKEYWFIGEDGIPHAVPSEHHIFIERMKEIGNYFSSEEEAELAVCRLKAWKRLKDKGFRFTNWEFRDVLGGDLVIEAKLNFDNASSIQRDLDTCFGGEE